MRESDKVEISPDQLFVRTKDEPGKWPIEGPDIHLSSLKPDVPEFVPGKMYQRTGRPSSNILASFDIVIVHLVGADQIYFLRLCRTVEWGSYTMT